MLWKCQFVDLWWGMSHTVSWLGAVTCWSREVSRQLQDESKMNLTMNASTAAKQLATLTSVISKSKTRTSVFVRLLKKRGFIFWMDSLEKGLILLCTFNTIDLTKTNAFFNIQLCYCWVTGSHILCMSKASLHIVSSPTVRSLLLSSFSLYS